MRLTQQQVADIRTTAFEVFGEGAQVWLFGSRVDDRKRGGDIDLLVRPAAPSAGSALSGKIRFLNRLAVRLGERKVDVVVECVGDSRPIVQVAHETGVML